MGPGRARPDGDVGGGHGPADQSCGETSSGESSSIVSDVAWRGEKSDAALGRVGGGHGSADQSGGETSSGESSSYASDVEWRGKEAEMPYLTWLVVLANVFWFVIMLGLQEHHWAFAPWAENRFLGPSPVTLVAFGALDVPLMRRRGEWWRLASCCFVHVGIIHVACNVLALLALGGEVERNFGHWRFAVLYVATGLFGSAVAALFAPEMITSGASGAIIGLFGAFWSVLLQNTCYVGCGALCRHCCLLAWQTALLAFISVMPFVSAWAHLGGLVMGFLLGNVLTMQPVSGRRGLRLRQLLFALASLAAAATLAALAGIALARDADVRALCPWCEALQCFDTPFWNCCDFSGAQCAYAARSCPAGKVEYWMVCGTNSSAQLPACGAAAGAPAGSPPASPAVFGPLPVRPNSCDCLANCGPGERY